MPRDQVNLDSTGRNLNFILSIVSKNARNYAFLRETIRHDTNSRKTVVSDERVFSKNDNDGKFS